MYKFFRKNKNKISNSYKNLFKSGIFNTKML